MRFISEKIGKTLFRNMMLIVGASIVVSIPIFLNGVPNGNDMPQHFQFAQTYREGLLSGQIYPSWAGSTNYGFGDVGIRFYPPIAYYVMVGFQLLSGDWFTASALSFWFFFFIGGV